MVVNCKHHPFLGLWERNLFDSKKTGKLNSSSLVVLTGKS